MVCKFSKKINSDAGVSGKFSKIFKQNYFVELTRTDAWVKWTKKKCIHKIYSMENTGDGVLFIAVSGMWAYSFSKKGALSQMLFYENWEVLRNINFTE